MTTALDGKVALVTGAGGGIGLATAEAFAKAGASVVLADRDEETIGKAAEGLRAAGHNTIGVTCDVTDTAQVEAMIERALSTYGRLDAAFNNAGVNSEAAALLETSDNEFERVMSVNLRGVWNCMKGEPSPDGGAGKWCHCQLFFDRRLEGFNGTQRLFCEQACGDRSDAERRSRLCGSRHPHQRGLPGNGQHADGSLRHEKLRPGNRKADGGARTHRTLR